MRIKAFSIVSQVILLLQLFTRMASAQDNNHPALAALARLINRAVQSQQNNKTFGEFPDLVAAYVAAEVELKRPPIEDDLTAITQSLITNGVGDAEKKAPTTSQQNGATANSVGTTTLTEKPGIADLINLAIERGAITKTTSGTSFTLQTTPYMIYSQFGAKDTEDHWRNLATLRHIGISATFDQSDGTTTPTSNNFESGEIKYALGDRSPRDAVILDQIRAFDFSSIEAVGKSQHELQGSMTALQLSVLTAAEKSVQSVFTPGQQVTAAKIMDKLKDSLKSVQTTLTPNEQFMLTTLVANLDKQDQSLAAISDQIQKLLATYLEAPHPQFSFAYSYHRDLEVSDFSDFKGIFGYTSQTLSTNLDGDIMINNNRLDVTGHALDRIRAYGVSGGLTLGKFANDSLDFTAAFSWMRPRGNSQDIRSFQAKLNLYLAQGLTVPFSLSYTNSTIDPNSTQSAGRSRVRLNVGLVLTGDALMGVARATPKQGS